MNFSLFKFVRGLGLALAVCLTSIHSFAGDIIGQVIDANTGGYLPGVAVQVADSNRSAYTDREGRFRISGVDAGSYTLRVRYIGYNEVVETVQVPETGAVRTEIVLGSEVIELETLVVEGYREARSMALQQKKSVGNIMDIISADSVGSLPDRNIADALARMPGLSLDVSGGEGRFVTIRGIDPNLNQVTFNGATLAAPGVNAREGRAMPLDVVGSSQISQIEVIKSVTPDMDANALGGSVNIVSASGFDRKERFIFGSAEIGAHQPAGEKGPGVSEKVASDSIYSFDITYGDVLGANNNIGLALSANYSKRHYQAHDLQANWSTPPGAEPFMNSFEMLPEDGERERMGLNLNLEFRPDDNAEFYVRAIYNEFNEERAEDEIIFGTNNPTLIAPRVVEFARVRPERRTFVEETEQTMYNISVGGNRRFDRLTASGDVTYSFAEELNPIIASVQFRPPNINMPAGNRMQIDFNDFYPVITRHADLLEVPGSYELRRFREEDSTVREKTWSPRFDLKWDFDQLFGGRSGFFKTGMKFTTRDRFVDDNSSRPTNGDLLLTDIGAALPGDGRRVFDGRYTTGLLIDHDAAFAFLNANRGLFEVDEAESASNSVEDDYDIEEEILALYFMGSIDLSDRLQMIVGGRYERTDATLNGFEYRELDGDFQGVFPNRSEFEYDTFLPNLQFRYAASDRMILRMAITGTIGRPAYEDAAPGAVLEFDPIDEPSDPAFPFEGGLEIGNPSLEPYEAINFDLSLEYYLESGGLLAISFFHKEIDNPIYSFSETRLNTIYNGIAFEELDVSTVNNADSGRVTGVELTAQVPFSTFTTGFLDGFGVDANASFMSSSADTFDRPNDDIPFFRQPDTVVNLALYYQKHKFSARAAYNYHTENIRTVGGNAGGDRYRGDRYYVDLQASYKISDSYIIYANWKNITDQPNELYQGNSAQLRNAEIYGSEVRAGIRFIF